MAQIMLDPNSVDDYRTFLKIKSLPSYRIRGRMAEFPDEYAAMLGVDHTDGSPVTWDPSSFMFDYQRAITRLAIQKRKYAVFADCGLGKTLIQLEFAQASLQSLSKRNQGFLIVAPLMVVSQTITEAENFYPGIEIEKVNAAGLQEWLDGCGGKLGITNYEAIKDVMRRGQLGGLLLDESSMLKSHYGKWGTRLPDRPGNS